MINNIKKEIIIGLISIGIIIILIIYYYFSFTNKPKVIKTTSQKSKQTEIIYDAAEVAKHNTRQDCYIIIENKVYAVSGYLSDHPDGGKIIIPYCGADASQAFITKAGRGKHSDEAYQIIKKLFIGNFSPVSQ